MKDVLELQVLGISSILNIYEWSFGWKLFKEGFKVDEQILEKCFLENLGNWIFLQSSLEIYEVGKYFFQFFLGLVLILKYC